MKTRENKETDWIICLGGFRYRGKRGSITNSIDKAKGYPGWQGKHEAQSECISMNYSEIGMRKWFRQNRGY